MSRGRKYSGSLFISLLGGFRVSGPHAGNVLPLDRKKTRALLAVLALDRGRLVPRARLTALLWPEQSEDIGRHGLRQCLLDLRHALAKGKVEAIRAERDLIGLEAARIVVDVARFDRLIDLGNATALKEAMELYHGDLLEGFSIDEPTFEDWLQVERERLRSRAVMALRKLLVEHVREKVTDAAVHVAVRLLAFEPFDEAVHRTLMRLYAESGRRSTALGQYETCVELLSRELGVEPEAETRELYRHLVFARGDRPKTPGTPRGKTKTSARAVRREGAFLSRATMPLIGRGRDLDWFAALWKLTRHGPQLVLVLGEAGIGKSRFVAELASSDLYRQADFLIGRGREGEDVLTFGPWVEALRQVLNQDLVARLTPIARVDLARLFPEIADGAVLPPSGIEEGPRIFEAVAHLLRLLSAERPLVIVIEDLHWCDDMTVRLLRFLPRRLEGRSVLLLGTARQAEIPAGPGAALDALRQDPSCTAQTLAPLSREEAMQLFRALLASRGGAPAGEVVEHMWRLSEGNPFVVIECARAVRDRGNVHDELSLVLPDPVRALTARSLARLSDRAARLTDVAAVIGRDLDVALLRQAAGLTEVEVAEGVEELVRRHVLREVDGRFDFSHDRVREVAYASLLAPRRALLHRQVAEGLDAVYAGQLDPHLAAIGAHYREAGVWDRASTYLAQAGFQAWERGAGREALACFEDALQAIMRLPDTEERRALQVHLRLVANGASWAIGSYERGLPHLQAAEALARNLSDRRWGGRVAAFLCNFHRATGSLDQALPLGHFALDVALETGDRELESAARLLLAYCEFNTGQFRRGLDHLSRLPSAGAPCPGLKGPHLPFVDTPSLTRVMTRFLMVNNLTPLGEFDAAKRVVDEMLRECDTVEDPLRTSRLLAQMSLGNLERARGNFPAALQAAEAALAAYREDCHRPWYRPLSWALGVSYALTGRVGEGIDVLEKADAADRKIRANAFRPLFLLRIGRVFVEAGRLNEAAQYASEALELARTSGRRPAEAGAHGLLGEVAMRRDPVDHAEMELHVRNCLALAEALEMRPLAAHCHLRLAWLAERTGVSDRESHESAARSLLASMSGVVRLDPIGFQG